MCKKKCLNQIKSLLLSVVFIFIVCLLISCNDTKRVDFELEMSKILELHHTQRDYHFNKDSIAFVNQLSDNFISVNHGEISHPQRQENISRFHSYFSSVKFKKWDDLNDPIIKFSDDGSMAYAIVDKIVSLTYETEEGEIIADSTHFAWTAIFKKYDGEWKIDNVTSTQAEVNQ